jgi:hypothetical protein
MVRIRIFQASDRISARRKNPKLAWWRISRTVNPVSRSLSERVQIP